MTKPTLIYTWTDEAPALATHSLLPIIRSFTKPAGITVETLADDCLPNQLCLYLYELAGLFMQFYEACPVLKATGDTQASRLGLCQLTALTLQQGLALLGITTLEQM